MYYSTSYDTAFREHKVERREAVLGCMYMYSEMPSREHAAMARVK